MTQTKRNIGGRKAVGRFWKTACDVASVAGAFFTIVGVAIAAVMLYQTPDLVVLERVTAKLENWLDDRKKRAGKNKKFSGPTIQRNRQKVHRHLKRDGEFEETVQLERTSVFPDLLLYEDVDKPVPDKKESQQVFIPVSAPLRRKKNRKSKQVHAPRRWKRRPNIFSDNCIFPVNYTESCHNDYTNNR
jgi:hypothetical protein